MTTNDIDAIEARANAATPGPWEATHGITYDPDAGLIEDREFMIMRADDDTAIAADVFDPVSQKPSAANCEFIAAARQDVPALCAEVRELRAALERARALVAEQATIITANVWHIPPEYSARNIIMDVAIKLRELAAELAEGGRP